jgi:hypothetical protein
MRMMFCLMLLIVVAGCRPAEPPPLQVEEKAWLEHQSGAAADVRFFLVPDDLAAGDLVCRDQARTYVADEEWPESRPDAQMHRVGTCVDPELNLYAYAADDPIGQESPGGEARVYVKVGGNRYLRLRR